MSKIKPQIIQLPKIYDPRGSLSFLQNGDTSFDIKRVYWIYDVPAGAERGAHSHRQSEEIIVAMSGSFKVNLFDGREHSSYELNCPYQALRVPPGYWRTLDKFSSGACCMVLTSTIYDEADYIRDFDEFMESAASE